MKKKVMTYGMAISLVGVLASTLTGCKLLGQGRKETKEGAGQSAAPNDSSEKLGLRLIFSQDSDPHIPDASADLKSNEGAKSDEKVVASDNGDLDFPIAITLPHEGRPRARYMVWSEDWRGRRIRAATVGQRIEEEDGRLTGPVEPIDVHYDATSRRWFFPLTALIRQASGGEDSGRPHQLIFDLTLDNGERVLVHARLRFKPRNSALKFGAVSAFYPLDFTRGPGMAHKLGTDGLLLRTTSITNPFTRPTTAWVKSNIDLTLKTYIGVQIMVADPTPRHVPPSWLSSQSRLRLVAGSVRRESGALESIGSRNMGWTAVNLAPRETVIVSWIAVPATDDHCVLPSPQPRSLGQYGKVQDVWAMGGFTLSGGGALSISFTQAGESAAAIESEEAPLPQTLRIDFSEHYGGGDESSPPYSCQGWIKVP